MRIKIFFCAALSLAGLKSTASVFTDTLTASTMSKYLKPVKIGPPEYFLPLPVVKPAVDSALLARLAIDESYKNRKAKEVTVNFYRNIQKLGSQMALLESYPPGNSAEGLESFLISSRYAGDKRTQLFLLNSLARFYVSKGNLAKAGGYLAESLTLKEQLADKSGASAIMLCLADLSKLDGKYELAASWQERLLSASLAAGKNLPIAGSYLSLSSIRLLQGNFDEAERLIIKKALPAFRGNKEGRLSCFEELSSVYYQQKRYSEAKWYSLQAKNIADQLKITDSQVVSLSRLAAIKNIEGDREHALQDLKLAETIALQNNFTERLMEIKGDIGEIYRDMGNYVAAGSFINQFTELSKNIADTAR